MIERHKFYFKRTFKKYLFFIIVFLVIVFCIRIKIYDNQSYKAKFLLNFDNFQYIIQNDLCNEEIFLLILIHSAANHFHHRNLIRNTWGRPDVKLPKVKVAFLLAISAELQNDIEEENNLYHDIIQGNFIDSYHNLTYKHVMGLKWASEHCANKVKYLMKMDDDIFMDIYQFMEYINTHFTVSKLRKNITCFLQSGMPVVRDPVSKWYVSKTEYPSNIFENYCSGWAYLTTTEAAHHLVKAVKQLNYFWVDDVHITGSAAKIANISHIRINSLFDLESDGLAQWSNDSANLKWNKMFAPTWGDLVLSRKAYRKTLMCYTMGCKCCYVRKTTPIPTQPSTTRKGVAKIVSIFK